MNMFKNFDFGPCANGTCHMSMYGIAIKNSNGNWVSYNTKDKTIIDVDVLNFDCGKYLYKMPVAIKDIKVGDVVIHAKKPMFVTSVNPDKTLTVVDSYAGESKNILLTRSPFGFDFATKIVSLFNFDNMNASADNPFGDNPILFAMLMSEGNTANDMLLPLMMMNGGKMDMSNPMMMYMMLSGDNKGDNLLPLLLCMNSGGCNCHCTCDEKADK